MIQSWTQSQLDAEGKWILLKSEFFLVFAIYVWLHSKVFACFSLIREDIINVNLDNKAHVLNL